ncbi:MAG: hypothetical protein EPO65_00260 [Dehalococcoidia bacterium]|nr:MAG: hypothetical protein EPO65_00260 [Dehalococcoidia bacterium]
MSDEQNRAAALAREWREVRGTLLGLAEQLPETRLGKATERAGWTVRHELAHFAVLDRDIAHVFERAAAEAGHVVDEAREAVTLRRMRGQAMFAAQELRLTPLRAYLADAGERAAAAIEAHGALLAHPVKLAGREAATVAEHLDHALARAREGVAVLREAIK